MSRLVFRFFCFILLLLVFFAIHRFCPQYRTHGPEILKNADFSLLDEDWDYSGGEGNLRIASGEVQLRNPSGKDNISLRQTIEWPPGEAFVQLSAEMRSEDIEPGNRSWHLGRLVLPRYGVNNQWLNRPHYSAVLSGTRNWSFYQNVFQYIPEATRTDVLVQLPYARGLLAARNVSLKAASPNRFYPCGQAVALGFGGLFLSFLIRQNLAGGNSLRLRTFLLLISLMILCGTLIPHTLKQELLVEVQIVTDIVETQAVSLAPEVFFSGPDLLPMEKWLHLGGFFLLGSVLFFVAGPAWTLLDGLLFAATTELMQLHIAGRTAQFEDVIVDLCGLSMAVLLIFSMQKIRKISTGRTISG